MKAHRFLTTLVASTALCTAGGAALAVPARASTLVCGDTVTADVTLTADLTCSGTALRVQVSGTDTVHIALAGHRITGDGTGVGIEVVPVASPGSLAVSGGTVRGFASALVGPGGPAFRAINATVDQVDLRNNGQWLPAGSVRRTVTVTRSRIVDSGPGGAGTDSGTLIVRNSSFLRSTVGSASESFNYLYDSVFTDGGFRHGFAANVIATGNTFRRCDIGIDVPDVWPSSPTTIKGNVFDACRIGLSLTAIGGTASVRGNTFTHNSGDGFTFRATGTASLTVEGNRFVGNGGNGMSGVGNPGVTVTRNVAVGNAGHGIDVTGVTDGGGNVAAANHTQPQCIGVSCTR
jgi:hypothetical protein